ncbi:ABC transporter substrate-binding protein [Streptomyces ferrugineus]|uniref:ABC transporter substrate-binding protein n=1 Tax=Streptomyces ferrugineus TaxID=1413221 RepID=UPI001D13446E|nr:sugar ABC transporter substrate-binding protein [Streptomyces ferrugineus]
MAVALLASLALGTAACAENERHTTITVASVDFTRDMEKLVDDFRRTHPHIRVRFRFLPESVLRNRLSKDIAGEDGRYDVVSIGPWEAPIWASRGWLTRLDALAGRGDYDVQDFIPVVRTALSYRGGLYAVPYYGESSFLMYRKDLFAEAGLTMPERPTWPQVAALAARLDDDRHGIAGICLRGGPAWLDLLPLNTVILTFGGRWFDERWNPRLTSPETKRAVRFYVDLVRGSGEPRAFEAGPAQCDAAMRRGKAAMMYDSTFFAGRFEDPGTSEVAGKLGYAPAPVMRTDSSGWLWTWALAIPVTSKHPRAAWEFTSWATSKRYVKLYGERLGWVAVPPGSRLSTYRLPPYRKAAKAFLRPALDALGAVNLNRPGLHEQPWTGTSYVGIPEYAGLGARVAEEISAAIAGRQSVDEALAKAQIFANDVVDGGGYRD